MKNIRTIIIVAVCATLVFCTVAKTVEASNSYVLMVGETRSMKIVDTKKEIVWKSSKKSVATVNSKGMVTAKKIGVTLITANVGNREYEYKIRVAKTKKAIIYTISSVPTVTPNPTNESGSVETPSQTPEPTPTPSPILKPIPTTAPVK